MSDQTKHKPLVAIISNPLSTTNKKCLPDIRAIIEQQSNVIHYELDKMESIREALEMFEKAKPDLLVINSGDGTVGAVMAMILYDQVLTNVPPIAIIPGGKTNMTAADLNVKGGPVKVLKEVFAIVNSDKIKAHTVVKNLISLDMNDGSPVKVGTFFGGAGVVRAIEWCRNYAHTLSIPIWLAHIWTIINLILSTFGLSKHKDILLSDEMTVHVTGHGHFKGQYGILTVTSLDKVLLGMQPFDTRAKGALKMALVKPSGKIMLKGFWSILRGRFGRKVIPGVEARNSDEIKVSTTDMVTLDGEIFTPVKDKPIILRGDKKLSFLKL